MTREGRPVQKKNIYMYIFYQRCLIIKFPAFHRKTKKKEKWPQATIKLSLSAYIKYMYRNDCRRARNTLENRKKRVCSIENRDNENKLRFNTIYHLSFR